MGDFHLWATYGLIAATLVGYMRERWPLEVTALASLAAFLALFTFFPYKSPGGVELDPEMLLSGFANSALATVLALLIVGQGLFATDAIEAPLQWVRNLSRGRNSHLVIALTLITAAALSAFLNNTPVVVIFIPVVTVLAAQRGIDVEKTMIPLSFLCILGGMTTLIGSSTNLLVAGSAAKAGVEIGFFDITIPGLVLASVGAVYVLFVIPRLIKPRENANAAANPVSGVHFIGDITLTRNHPFVGIQSTSGLFPGMRDMTPRAIRRNRQTLLPPFDDITLQEGDILVVTATRRAFLRALALGTARGTEASASEIEELNEEVFFGPDYHIAEVVVAPGSRHAGRTVRYAGIETQHNVSIVGVQRKSRMGRTALADIRLEPGDTLLVGGHDDDLAQLRSSHELLLLEWSTEAVPQMRKAGAALLIFGAIVFCAATGMAPIAPLAVIGAFLMLLTGCLTLQQAVRAFDTKIFLLVGSSIAAALALEQTGGAALIADSAVTLLANQSPAVLLSAMFALIAVLTNVLTNNATAVLFTPIALGLANALNVPPEGFLAAVIFASNTSFATPIGYQTNLLVMGPGHYRFSDFVKTGVPLVIIMWLTFTLFGPWYYSL